MKHKKTGIFFFKINNPPYYLFYGCYFIILCVQK